MVTPTTSSNRGQVVQQEIQQCSLSSTLATQQDLQRERILSATTGTHPNTCTLSPPGNNPPPTSWQDNSQRLPTLLAQVTANHEQYTFGDFLHDYLQAVSELVTHTTLPLNPSSFVFEWALQVAQHN